MSCAVPPSHQAQLWLYINPKSVSHLLLEAYIVRRPMVRSYCNYKARMATGQAVYLNHLLCHHAKHVCRG